MLRIGLRVAFGMYLAATVAVGRAQEVRDALLNGVKEIAAPGAPGSLAVFAPRAEAVVVGNAGAGGKASVVAASTLGRGRIVAFAHDGYFGPDFLAKLDTARLVENAVRWAADGKRPPKVGVIQPPALVEFLKARGVDAAATSVDEPWEGFNVLVVTPYHLTPPGADRIQAFVRSGGGLLAATTGWGWQQGSRAPMSEFAGNRMLAGSGLAWSDGFAGRTTTDGYSAGGPISPFLNATTALDALKAGREPGTDDFAAGIESVLLALRSLTPADSKFRSDVVKALKGVRGIDLIPTQKSPANMKDMRRRFAIGLETAVAQAAPVDEVRALPAAADFPGAVDPKIKRVTRTGTIDLSIPRWHSLGLYAPPGAKVTVTGPEKIGSLKLGVQVGSHTDRLWHLDSWKRLPEIARRFPIAGSRTVVASAMGGMLYIDVPDAAPREPIELTIAGAVEAPLFRLGETTAADWKTIRNRPAPWAELAGRNVVFTVPSELARRVDDPEPLMAFWDAVVADQDATASSRPRRSPERIVVDRQISAGYMHSGYPIMGPIDDSTTTALDLAKLRAEGAWGYFHELGHNHQEREWTFDGTGEVTNNVLAVHVFTELLNLPFDIGHDAIRGKAMRDKRIQEHIAKGAPFDAWKRDPFLALMMYLQLYEGFGWEPFEKVFAEYARLPRDERPRDDDAKRDQWMVRFSRTVGKNLGPFFQTWGVPTSQAARDSLKDLPTWSPPGMDVKP